MARKQSRRRTGLGRRRRASYSKGKFSHGVNLDVYIRKVLKQVHPHMHISTDAMAQLNAFLNNLAKHLVVTAIKAKDVNMKVTSRGSAKKRLTLSSREIMYAAKLFMPGELGRHAVSELTKALNRYSGAEGGYSGVKTLRISRKSRAGLVMSPARVNHMIRQVYSGRTGGGVSISLTAILEYIAAEILEISGNAARDNKRKTITPQMMMLATSNDRELHLMLQYMHWSWSGAGGIVDIHPGYYVHLEKLKSKRKARKSGRKGRKRSGKKRSPKKTSKMSFGRRSFGSGRGKGGKGLGRGGAARRYRGVIRDSIQGIKMGPLKRLSKRAGVLRATRLIYEELRMILKMYVEDVVRTACEYANASRKRTINKEDVYAAVNMKMFPAQQIMVLKSKFGALAGRVGGVRRPRRKSGYSRMKKQLSQIRYYQKSAGLILAKLPMKRIIKEAIQDICGLRITTDAVKFLHEYVEMRLVTLLKNANYISMHSGNTTLRQKDIHLARRILGPGF
jgi:histone H4